MWERFVDDNHSLPVCMVKKGEEPHNYMHNQVKNSEICQFLIFLGTSIFCR